jgi:acetyl esterase/lipase
VIELVSYGTQQEQFGELRLPDGHSERPLVMLIHGGFWRDQYRLGLMHPLAQALNQRGYPSWNIEYRRVGPTGGGYPTTLDDISAAIDRFAGLGWAQTAVIGHSAGGHLALWNASRANAQLRPDLTVGLAPVADVIAANTNRVGVDATANFFGGDIGDVPERYAHAQPNPVDFSGRVVLLHGDNDDSVPLAQLRSVEAYADRVEVLEGVGHFDVINPEHASSQIVFDELDALGA